MENGGSGLSGERSAFFREVCPLRRYLDLKLLKTTGLTVTALLGFASNSVLCRAALGEAVIDPMSYTMIRVLAGAVALVLVSQIFDPGRSAKTSKGWGPAIALATYAIAFSLAYVHLSTANGALILFGAVQLTMILAAFRSGHRPHVAELMGCLIAIAGLIYLVAPGLSAPSLGGSALMGVAGIAWGFYSLPGPDAVNPVRQTATNFARASFIVLPVGGLGLWWFLEPSLSTSGVVLAILSGSVASGIGYSIWYAALPGLSRTQAAVVQLSVPIIAAAMGAVWLAELPTFRMYVASALILVGIAIATFARNWRGHNTSIDSKKQSV